MHALVRSHTGCFELNMLDYYDSRNGNKDKEPKSIEFCDERLRTAIKTQ